MLAGIVCNGMVVLLDYCSKLKVGGIFVDMEWFVDVRESM